MVVAMLLGASASLTEFKSDAELEQLELRNFYSHEDLKDLRINQAVEMIKEAKDFECEKKSSECASIKKDRLQNAQHMEHRMDLW